MTSKWQGQACPLCGDGVLVDSIKKAEEQYKGRSFTSTIHGAFCDHCQDGFPEFDPEQEIAWTAFRNRVDAEDAAELARIRKKLRLTQSEAAILAGGGKNAFSRYEKGKAKPVAAVTNLFRLLDHHPELLNELRHGSSNRTRV
ncbi:MAG: type II toxin-antitoxin system MqsA family antitoxin [Sulfuricellaceae bacterium]|nr:type II toxin-antitoxin system MqsA family antitoxin [Sulfuricellaceae bacterium]